MKLVLLAVLDRDMKLPSTCRISGSEILCMMTPKTLVEQIGVLNKRSAAPKRDNCSN